MEIPPLTTPKGKRFKISFRKLPQLDKYYLPSHMLEITVLYFGI